MAKRSVKKAKLGQSSELESVYKDLFNQARYAYEQREIPPLSFSQTTQHERDSHRLSVLEVESFIERLKLSEIASRSGQAISYETEKLVLPVGASTTFEFNTEPAEAILGSLYITSAKGTLYSYQGISPTAIPYYVADLLPVEYARETSISSALKPRFSVTYRARLMRGEHKGELSYCVIEDQVKYYTAGGELSLAQESHSRVYWLTKPQKVSALKTLPLSSRYWMGEYHYKRLHRYPCSNELPGYEYEAKLTPKTLFIDESLLPYQVIERYQTESVRWYLANGEGRVGFREGRASMVKKGKKIKLGLILKREEEKTQGLSMWSLGEEESGQDKVKAEAQPIDADALQMRRVKRQLYLLNPESSRVYALCLDYCYVTDLDAQPLLQIELEYNGTLCLPIESVSGPEWLSAQRQLELAYQLAVEHPKAALRCIERANLISSQQEPKLAEIELNALNELGLKLQEQLDQELRASEQLNESSPPTIGLKSKEKKEKKKKKELKNKKSATVNENAVENEVLAEMTTVLRSLIELQDCVSTALTKRKWLKATIESNSKSAMKEG